MDDRANWSQWTSWLFRLEGEMRYQGRSHQSLKQSHWHSSCMLFRVSHSALCPTRARWPRGSCPGRHWDCTPAWSAPTITPGSSTPPATGSASSKCPPRLVSQTRSHSTINAWNSSSSPLKETFSLWTMNQSKLQPHQSRISPLESLSRCFASLLSLCIIFQHSTDLRWSQVNLRQEKD